MNEFKEFCKLVTAIMRIFFIYLFIKLPVKILSPFAKLKNVFMSHYYRNKFPTIAQQRKLLPSEALAFHDGIQAIRAKALNAIEGNKAGTVSNSQKKKLKAQTHNDETLFCKQHGVVVINGEYYKQERHRS